MFFKRGKFIILSKNLHIFKRKSGMIKMFNCTYINLVFDRSSYNQLYIYISRLQELTVHECSLHSVINLWQASKGHNSHNLPQCVLISVSLNAWIFWVQLDLNEDCFALFSCGMKLRKTTYLWILIMFKYWNKRQWTENNWNLVSKWKYDQLAGW